MCACLCGNFLSLSILLECWSFNRIQRVISGGAAPFAPLMYMSHQTLARRQCSFQLEMDFFHFFFFFIRKLLTQDASHLLSLRSVFVKRGDCLLPTLNSALMKYRRILHVCPCLLSVFLHLCVLVCHLVFALREQTVLEMLVKYEYVQMDFHFHLRYF